MKSRNCQSFKQFLFDSSISWELFLLIDFFSHSFVVLIVVCVFWLFLEWISLWLLQWFFLLYLVVLWVFSFWLSDSCLCWVFSELKFWRIWKLVNNRINFSSFELVEWEHLLVIDSCIEEIDWVIHFFLKSISFSKCSELFECSLLWWSSFSLFVLNKLCLWCR